MARKKPKYRNPLRTREAIPKLKKTKDGVELLCPFCDPPHPILPGVPTVCGATLRVTAVQQIIISRVTKHEKLICMKCHQGGGEMVKFMNGFVHLVECAPDVNLIADPPKNSKVAKRIYGFPKRLRAIIEKFTGVVNIVKVVDPLGNETGEIQSYFFAPKKVKNARKTRTSKKPGSREPVPTRST